MSSLSAASAVSFNDTTEDRQAIQPILNQIMVYPLTQFDAKMKTKDWKKVPSFPVRGQQGQEEIHWVNLETFFRGPCPTDRRSSWLNQVECWFGLNTDRMIRRGTFRSVPERQQSSLPERRPRSAASHPCNAD